MNQGSRPASMAVYQPKGSTGASGNAAFEVHTDGGDLESVKAELAREQERLRKLWDAFKAQEDELNGLKAGAPAAASATALRSTPSTGAADQRTIDSLRREIDLLTSDLKRAGEQQRRLEEENVGLRAQAREMDDVNRRASGLQSDLEQERERLAKLYVVYEEVEAERARLEQHLKEWDAWYHGVAPHLAEICRSIGGAPHST
jgi:chromosome segregation ATPase